MSRLESISMLETYILRLVLSNAGEVTLSNWLVSIL